MLVRENDLSDRQTCLSRNSEKIVARRERILHLHRIPDQLSRSNDLFVELVLAVRVNGFRFFTLLKPPDHGPVCVVAATGRGQ